MATFPPGVALALQKTIPSYLFQQYNDDADLQAFIEAYNDYTQAYVDWFNQTPLAVYTNANINGALLDWVAASPLYGMVRPSMPLVANRLVGPYNTMTYNQRVPYNGIGYFTGVLFGPAPDDVFKRIITWNYFKGDGFVFNVSWLKRRIIRFLTGANGIDPGVDETYAVSVAFASGNTIIISGMTANLISSQLAYGIRAGILALPFQFTFLVVV